MVAVAAVFEYGRTPAQWVSDLATRGISVSERTLRERARHLGACRMLGKTMILLPEHIDQIFEVPECRSKSTSEAQSSGYVDTLLMTTNMSDKALEHLTKLSRKQPPAKSKRRPANVVSLDRMRPSSKM